MRQCVVHQQLPTVKEFDKSRTGLLDLLTASLPGLPHRQLYGVALCAKGHACLVMTYMHQDVVKVS